MLSTQTVQELINNFELYQDDTTELAEAEEISVLNKVLRKIGKERDWFWLNVNYSGTLVNNQLTLPTDFTKFVSNHANNQVYNIGNENVVFVGQTAYPIISSTLRFQPEYSGNFAFLEGNVLMVNNPTSNDVKFTYKKKMGQVTVVTDTLPIPVEHEDVLLYGMLIDDTMIIKLKDISSFLPQNMEMYKEHMGDLRVLNSQMYN